MTWQARKQDWTELAPRPVEGIEPPHDLTAERRVIETALAVPGYVDRVCPPLEAHHMYSEANRRILEGCIAVKADGEVDAIRVCDWLRANGRLDQVGGARALSTPASLTESEQREAVSAARLVWELFNRRQLALHCQQAVATIYHGDTASTRALFDKFEEQTFAICRSAVRGADTTSAKDGFEQFLLSVINPDTQQSISSGVRSYDTALGGMPLGEYTIIGASSGQGKTSWGLNVAVNVALAGGGVLYVSTEMKARDLMMLASCSFASVPAMAVRMKNLSPIQQGRIIATAARFKDLPLHIDDNFGQSLNTIRSQARRLISSLAKTGKRLKLIVVDYMQDLKLPPSPKFAAADGPLSDLSRGLCDLGQQTGAHVLALSQLNDNARMRTSGERKPEIGDLKGAKAIAFPAQVVAFIHREKNKEGKYEARGVAEIWIRKARFAPTDPIEVIFDATLGRFEDAEYQ